MKKIIVLTLVILLNELGIARDTNSIEVLDEKPLGILSIPIPDDIFRPSNPTGPSIFVPEDTNSSTEQIMNKYDIKFNSNEKNINREPASISDPSGLSVWKPYDINSSWLKELEGNQTLIRLSPLSLESNFGLSDINESNFSTYKNYR